MNCNLKEILIAVKVHSHCGSGGPAHGIVTKTLHKTLPGGDGGVGYSPQVKSEKS